MTRPAIPRRPMTADELAMARAVSPNRVTYLPGSPDKRFAWTICSATEITEAQASYLHRLVYRYRRQIPNQVVVLADRTVGNARPRSQYIDQQRQPPAAAPQAASDPQLTLEVPS